MPKGPKGERRPADVIGAAIRVGRIATGEDEDVLPREHARKGGAKGGKARAAALTKKKRKAIAKKAAETRWKKA